MTPEVILLCLALNIYFEARGEPIEGQYAVAEVALRRAALSSKPVCVEVFSDSQFSWTLQADTAKVRDKRMWATALTVARSVLAEPTNFSHGATHFHSIAVKPRWTRSLCLAARIGRHLFYRECR